MKKILLTSFVGILAVSAASAMTFAPYAAVRGGYNMTNVSNNFDDLDGNGFLVSGALGLELYSDAMFGIRAEAEYNYITADIDVPNSNGADATNSTVLANFFADFKTDSVITPYVSLGIGYGWTTIEDEEKINLKKIKKAMHNNKRKGKYIVKMTKTNIHEYSKKDKHNDDNLASKYFDYYEFD